MVPRDQRHVFNLSGPKHLKPVDWNNAFNRRSVAACLVHGVNISERDRQNNRHGPQALAPPWWKFCDFELDKFLNDKEDKSIFGSVYKHINDNLDKARPRECPQYVIAFRCTLIKPETMQQDGKTNLRCIFNKLHESPRFQQALDIVQEKVDLVGAKNVWLAGHSLGSAMALLAGKSMAKMGCFLETYLFNPPFLSFPIEWIDHNRVKDVIRCTRSFLKAGLTVALKESCRYLKYPEHDPFDGLYDWFPHLFVNPNDNWCSEYIRYFEERGKMEENGVGKIGCLATRNSMRCLLAGALGWNSEALHLLPSANLTTNLGPSLDVHGLDQWWNPDFPSQCISYKL